MFRSAEVLGVHRVEFLGWTDSGMMGEQTNEVPWCFWQADVEIAARRLATILEEESPDVITIYDDNGGYGHPDHIQVHRVGARAAELVQLDAVFQATMNRDRMREMMDAAVAEAVEALADEQLEERRRAVEEDQMGEPEAAITHAVDVVDFVGQKRQAMLAHASQIGEDSFFMTMPEEMFARAFGTEWFVQLGVTRAPDAPFGGDLFAGLPA